MGAWFNVFQVRFVKLLAVATLLFATASVLGQSTPAPNEIIDGIQQLRSDTKSVLPSSNRRQRLVKQLNRAIADVRSGRKELNKNKIKKARKSFRKAKNHLKRFRKILRKGKRKGQIDPSLALPLIAKARLLIKDIKDLLHDNGGNAPPIASAGSDQTLPLGENVILDGSLSSDEDGDALTYHWTVADPSGNDVTLNDSTSVHPEFVISLYGDYLVSLIVNDGQEDSGLDTAIISSRNSKPVADAGADQTHQVGEHVRLDGSASSDVDGDSLTYQWQLIAQPVGSTASLVSDNNVDPTFTIDKSGDYVIQLFVNDGLSNSELDTITVSTENSSPTADAGPNQSVMVGSTVTLDGSGSSDVDGDPLMYQWSITSKPESSSAFLSDIASIQPNFFVDVPGTYIVQLAVDDDEAPTALDTVTIVTENSPPVADAGSDQFVELGALVQLDAGSSSDVDGDALTYEWAIISAPQEGEIGLSDNSTVNPTFTAHFSGSYQLQVIVNDGQYSSEPSLVIVTTQNTRPVADAGSDQSAQLGDTVLLNGDASYDVDGDGLLYQWDLLAAPEGSSAVLQDEASIDPSFILDQPGVYQVQLIVSDGELESLPDVILITTENTRPQAEAGTNIDAYVGDLVQLDGSSSQDADGDQLSYEWSLVGQPNGSTAVVEQENQMQAQFVPDIAGAYVAQLIVHDAELASEPDSVVVTVQVTVVNHDPAITSAPRIEATVAAPYSYSPSATDEDGDTLNFQLTSSPQGMTIDTNSGVISWVPITVGSYDVAISVSDGMGGVAAQSYTIVVIGGSIVLPPDPETIAPPLDPTVATSMKESTVFLYSGSNPIQTGVDPDTIDEQRASVISGNVLSTHGQPLPGVTISIKDHPELGQTLSRANGEFDLVVNGGGLLTINYNKHGYLSAQRQVRTSWQEYSHAEDVVLVELDTQVTTIDLNNTSESFQVAQGSVSSDSDGQRQAMILFPQGTSATMTLPDGSTQPLTNLSVRATEYTVGENGPKRMPAPLPPTSGYTYAVELSVDEAIAASASRVDFNQPLPVYVDNFLEFPVGEIVPSGWYDYEQAAWIPADNGRIVEILSIDNNKAALDVDGDGLADSGSLLADLDVTDDELNRLADIYPVGKKLWRVQVTHFTPWDFNWPFGPPLDAEPPLPKPDDYTPSDEDQDDCTGCSIQPQSQSLGEEIPVMGTSYTLNYQSKRMSGFKPNRTLNIKLTKNTVPDSLKAIELSISVAGRVFKETFDSTPNQNYTFVWDGADRFGRLLTGVHVATVEIDYVYDIVYYEAKRDFVRSFAVTGQSDNNEFKPIGQRGSQAVRISRVWTKELYSEQAATGTFGGWGLNILHSYFPSNSRLDMGDGHSILAADTSLVISTFAGASGGFAGDGGPANQAKLNAPSGIDFDANGGLYIADSANHRVRYIKPNGDIETVAGNGTGWYSGDGAQAILAHLEGPRDVAVHPDGSLYIADSENHCIRRVGLDGIIETIAGTCKERGYSGDGAAATLAKLWSPQGLAIGPDGSLYIADSRNSRIRHVSSDGIITTFAGTGDSTHNGDGVATEANLNFPNKVAFGQDGSLYIADPSNKRVRRVTPDGMMTTFVGPESDGWPAESYPYSIAIRSDGVAYIGEYLDSSIRQVDPYGVITTIAGKNGRGSAGDGGPSTQAQLHGPSDIVIDPANNIYIADQHTSRIRRIHSPYGRFLNEYPTPSKDGKQLFVFDSTGRHLHTLDTITGVKLYQFRYNNQGYVNQIENMNGDITLVEYSAGIAIALVAPDGQRTELAIDSANHLSEVTDPAGYRWEMLYTPQGLLTSFIDRNNNESIYSYDTLGRLRQDLNAIGGGWQLTSNQASSSKETSMTTGEGRVSLFKTENLPTGGRRHTNTAPNGTQTLTDYIGSVTSSTFANGTVSNVTEGPDPRFGMLAPIQSEISVTVPSGLNFQTQTQRTADLSNSTDMLSVLTLSESKALNGRLFQSTFDATTHSWTSTSAENRTSTTVVDEKNRPVKIQASGLEPVELSYDSRGRINSITEGEGLSSRSTTFTYHDTGVQEGYLASITDALDRSIAFTYDANGYLKKQTQPDGREIGYSYDVNGNMMSLTPPGRSAHVFNYTAGDQEELYTPPNLSGVDTVTQYQYNRDKQLTLITRPDSKTMSFDYDSTSGQLDTLTIPRGNYTYSYDGNSGQLTSTTAPDGGVLNFNYDGFLSTGVEWAGPVTGSVNRTFDNNFWITSRNVNDDSISYSYDNDGLLTIAGSLSINREAQKSGLINGTTLDTLSTSHTHNEFGELTNYQVVAGNSAVAGWSYTRDKLGRITDIVETLDGISSSYNYSYDLAGRLDTVKIDSSVSDSFDYDSNGNHDGGLYNEQDQLLSWRDNSYSYGLNGELRSKTKNGITTTYDYDMLGNLTHATLSNDTTIDYVIDGRNRRIGKKINGTLIQGFLYQDQINPIAELDGENNVVSRFVYGDKANVPSYMVKDGNTYRIISDHLGSPRLVLDTTDGSIVQSIDYDVWGMVTNDTNPGFQPFGFAGGIYDQDTQLVRFGARDYDSEARRWTMKDPAVFAGRSANLYGYVIGNPINLKDPSGFSPFDGLGSSLNYAAGTVGSATQNAVGAAILSSGPGINSNIEQQLVTHYFFGQGSDFVMSPTQTSNYNQAPSSSEFDFGIGRPNPGSNGSIDYYDFDPQPGGDRTFAAELATIMAAEVGSMFGGIPFYIFLYPCP